MLSYIQVTLDIFGLTRISSKTVYVTKSLCKIFGLEYLNSTIRGSRNFDWKFREKRKEKNVAYT